MGVDTRPPWMTPIAYNDPSDLPPEVPDDEPPIDYGRRADNEEVFADDLEDDDLDADDEEDASP